MIKIKEKKRTIKQKTLCTERKENQCCLEYISNLLIKQQRDEGEIDFKNLSYKIYFNEEDNFRFYENKIWYYFWLVKKSGNQQEKHRQSVKTMHSNEIMILLLPLYRSIASVKHFFDVLRCYL